MFTSHFTITDKIGFQKKYLSTERQSWLVCSVALRVPLPEKHFFRFGIKITAGKKSRPFKAFAASSSFIPT
jgi:hypothetical protein